MNNFVIVGLNYDGTWFRSASSFSRGFSLIFFNGLSQNILILMINLKDLRQCFTFCIEHEGWPGNMAISLTQHEILVAWIERSVSWTRMWWILDGGSVGVFFSSEHFLNEIDQLWCKATHVTRNMMLSVFLNEIDQLWMWCWEKHCGNDNRHLTWKNTWERKVHILFYWSSCGMHACWPVSGVSFLTLRFMWSMWRNIFLKRLGWLSLCLMGWNLQITNSPPPAWMKKCDVQ